MMQISVNKYYLQLLFDKNFDKTHKKFIFAITFMVQNTRFYYECNYSYSICLYILIISSNVINIVRLNNCAASIFR